MIRGSKGMIEHTFSYYARHFGAFQTRSMFGGIGFFQSEAMFSLIVGGRIFVRGGGHLDRLFKSLKCEKYQHVKKQSIATVNYYDVTALFMARNEILVRIILASIKYSIRQRQDKCSRRLRDLPNMHLTLERMVKKAGVQDVDTFMRLGAAEVFNRVRAVYGQDVALSVLWKFAGAIEGVHWMLLQEPKKRQLLQQCQQ